MANQPFYKQSKFIPIYVAVALFIIAVVWGYIEYKKRNPDGTFF